MIHLGNDWDILLQDEFTKDYYLKLREFLKVEYGNQRVYPDMYDIFNALKYTAFKDVKVVILGQDPYHGAGQAHGMSFSVKPGVRTPPSLVNMYKELANDLGLEIPNNGYLLPWAEQGVLLLNTVLTVREGKPNSHAKQGWEMLTDTIISLLGQKEEPVVFLLWGNNAKSKQILLRNPNHLILTTVHPSPLSANRGFMGCRHFSQTNQYLKDNDVEPINWQIPNI
ncbi:uracil-DNA glycosylase [Paenilisteria rocourtiae]|uniref:Uracil-DNA glycosylase n=1 Tax=Listeria rocourtiae TaxID=647910 RepID=A0A4V3DQ81_9LIST|nr:uracil-DNA glycosylase [Listeria rocourtiae]EUJ44372.1 uracil-DNA glycosylase [Listeria rocourtiae FSL F6-920]MBC1603568.1 uracil-DNA glycosylase [Listeria rocourtiae]TDR55146.1 uracil-DNA glycosylase [Listeria rocourtiae]